MLNVRSKWKPIIIELKKVNFPVTGINIWPQIFQASNVSETSIVSAFPRLLDMATTFGVRTVVVVVLVVVVDVVVTEVVVKVDCDDPQQIWIYMDDKKWDTPHDLGRLPKNDIYIYNIYTYIYMGYPPWCHGNLQNIDDLSISSWDHTIVIVCIIHMLGVQRGIKNVKKTSMSSIKKTKITSIWDCVLTSSFLWSTAWTRAAANTFRRTEGMVLHQVKVA